MVNYEILRITPQANMCNSVQRIISSQTIHTCNRESLLNLVVFALYVIVR